MALQLLTQTQEQYSRLAILKAEAEAVAKDATATIDNIAPYSNFDNYTEQLNKYIEGLGPVVPLIAEKWYNITKKQPYTDTIATATFSEIKRRTEGIKPRSVPYITARVTLDKKKTAELMKTAREIYGIQFNVFNIIPIQWAKLGEFSYLMYHKQGVTGDAMDETKIGGYFGAIPNDNPAKYTETKTGVSINTYDNFKIGYNPEHFEILENTEDNLIFEFDITLLGLWTSETPIEKLWQNGGPEAYSKSLTIHDIITKEISLTFVLSDTTIIQPTPLYMNTYIRGKMSEIYDYQKNLRLNTQYPEDKENGGQLYIKPHETNAPDINEPAWAQSILKYKLIKKNTNDNILTYNLPCFATQYRGETGLYVSYTVSNIGEASGGYFRASNTDNIWTWYEGSNGFFNNTATIAKKIKTTEIIAGDDMQIMICDNFKDNERCLRNFDPVLDFKYTNKFYYTADKFITYGTGSVSIPARVLKGNIVNNLMGLTIGFGTIWR